MLELGHRHLLKLLSQLRNFGLLFTRLGRCVCECVLRLKIHQESCDALNIAIVDGGMGDVVMICIVLSFM